jgi:uncharacterized protein YqeY
MSNLKARLSQQMKDSMKSGDKETLTFVRNLHAAIRKKEIDSRVDVAEGAQVDLDDEGVVKIVTSLIKQRQDSIEQFKQGQRDDLVAKEEAELQFLRSYMPAQMSETELRECVAWAVTEAQAAGPKDMGKVMKLLLTKVQGRADGKLISQIVREKLG